jgi:hypothetical protein
MKRYIAAASFAVLAVPAFAAGLPYEQNQVDRAQPAVGERKVDARVLRFEAPYEQSVMDRALLNIEPRRTRFAAAAGSTLTDAGIETTESTESVWDNDHNFIAPAQ